MDQIKEINPPHKEANDDEDSLLPEYLKDLFLRFFTDSAGLAIAVAIGILGGLLYRIYRIEKLYKLNNEKPLVFRAQDEHKLLNEIHICSTLSHEASNMNRCVSLLMESPCAVNVPREPFGFTPFLSACWAGSKPLVRFMLQNGADLQRKTKDGDSALYLAVRAVVQYEKPDTQLLIILLQAGACVNDKNYGGQTALHLAAGAGNLEVTKWLVDRGADVNAKTASGQTAIQIAKNGDHQDVVQYLSSFSSTGRKKKVL